ncbi:leucyl/phenylalanyl-tRNA--protein transferase [Shewanella sp. NFH-SH190041]|uniref:leucyl/phenylalanyl-tRNA--protein transferase n=1 Tax=Shewanella sp. NFH-SH190041 TaxID=2950245 RepID=UPI0021C28CF9|nr:leucyl/phenylalanyl-tRNA--protein transferase [Shewanella sp. NFH-SH190041]BDM64917.1 leucyl/phenylalanyl-tRNA--protein transferase [Shewanella sp. NFH-SH190041]
MNSLPFLNPANTLFPPPEQALTDPNGLLAIGGDLSAPRLLSAYYNGIFPWFNDDDPILWWSPDPRAVFSPQAIHISHSLKKTLKKQPWRFTINHAFTEVITACAAPRAKQAGTWITDTIQTAYQALHQLKRAHSLEVWQDNELIGGLYGINVGGVFCGESMFHRRNNASKAAMAALGHHLHQYQYQLIDAQLMNPYLVSLGAKPLSRRDFLHRLHQLRDLKLDTQCWQPQEINIDLHK